MRRQRQLGREETYHEPADIVYHDRQEDYHDGDTWHEDVRVSSHPHQTQTGSKQGVFVESESSITAGSGIAEPESEQAETDQPESEQAETDQPESEQPEVDIPNAKSERIGMISAVIGVIMTIIIVGKFFWSVISKFIELYGPFS